MVVYFSLKQVRSAGKRSEETFTWKKEEVDRNPF